jgi:cardiolipin synthase
MNPILRHACKGGTLFPTSRCIIRNIGVPIGRWQSFRPKNELHRLPAQLFSARLIAYHGYQFVIRGSCANDKQASCRFYATSSRDDKSNRPENVEVRNGSSINESSRIIEPSPINQRAAKEIIKQLSSPPNILTMSRIIATPYLSYLLVSHYNQKVVLDNTDLGNGTVDSTIIDTTIHANTDVLASIDLSSTPVIALSLFLVMGFTDFLDGYIARRFDYATVLGTYLDPFADKVFISTMSITLWYIDTLPGALVGLWVVRDVGMLSTTYWMVRTETLERNKNNKNDEPVAVMDPTKTPLKVEANFLSKVNTTLQIGLIALGITGEVPSIDVPPELMTSLW